MREIMTTAEAQAFLDSLPELGVFRANGYWEIFSAGQLITTHQLQFLENGTWYLVKTGDA